MRPVIILSFANIKKDYLKEIHTERDAIYDKLRERVKKDKIDVEKIENTKVNDIFKMSDEYPGRFTIFHFAGHADETKLQLDDTDGDSQTALVEGLAGLMEQHKHLKLVFLNGCFTRKHVKVLKEAKVNAVIATSTKVPDLLARTFAVRFYSALSAGYDIGKAFDIAKYYLVTKGLKNKAKRYKFRDVSWKGKEIEEENNTVPWGLYYNENKPEALNWKLPEIVKPDEIPPEHVRDIYSKYEIGVKRLPDQLGGEHPAYRRALELRDDLIQNITKARNTKNHELTGAALSKILERINNLSETELAISFADFCDEADAISRGLQTREISFVISAMKGKEAKKLFEDIDRNDQLKDFVNHISGGRGTNDVIEELTANYGEKRKQWQPFKSGTTIPVLLENLMTRLEGKTRIKLFPRYLEDGFYSEDRDRRNRFRQILEGRECIFIVDVLSLFHTDIYRRFLQSNANSKAIICISPLSGDSMEINRILGEQIEDKLERVFDRYQRNFDRRCRLEVHSSVTLEHWLYNIVPDIVGKKAVADPDNSEKIETFADYKPQGIHRSFAN